MKKLIILLLALSCWLTSPTWAQKIEHGKRFRVLVLGMDGTKGVPFNDSVFLYQQSPNIKDIMNHGQYTTCENVEDTNCAHTHLGHRFGPDYAWVTSPGWAAVVTGVNTDKHLVKENDFEFQRVFTETTKVHPTFLSRLKQNGFVTAVGGVGNFLSSIGDDGGVAAGIVDYECGFDVAHQQSSVPASATSSCNANYRQSFNGDDEERDKNLAQWLIKMIQIEGDQSPDAIMGVFDTIDDAGHRYTFSSNPNYLKAIADVDAEIAKILAVLQQRVKENNEEWLVLITADHGGHGRDHGDKLFDDEVIPFVVANYGPQITLENKGPMRNVRVTQMDIVPSILHWLDVPLMETDGVVRSQYQWNV